MENSINIDDLGEKIIACIDQVVGAGDPYYPLHEPDLTGSEKDYVGDCVDSGWVSSVGSYVDRFEDMLANITGAKRAVACSSGTSALHISYILAGVEAGDEVLVPTLTFVATVNPIHYVKAVPHFIDSCDKTMAVDPIALEEYLSRIANLDGGTCINRETGRRISALIVTHIFGHAADLDALSELAGRWNLVLIEDAAEALGTRYKGKHVGRTGRVGTLSFNGNKIVTTGGGGAIISDNEELCVRAKHLTTTAKQSHPWAFDHDEVGYNYRLPNLNAALGCAQLERLQAFISNKAALAARYKRSFSEFKGLRFIEPPAFSDSNYWLNAIRIDGLAMQERNALLDMLADTSESRFMCRPIWTLMHKLPMNRDCPRAPLPVAERLEREVVNIPSSAKLGEALS